MIGARVYGGGVRGVGGKRDRAAGRGGSATFVSNATSGVRGRAKSGDGVRATGWRDNGIGC